jgi:hypothetical protein
MVRRNRVRSIKSERLADELLALRVSHVHPKQQAFADFLGINLSWYKELENGRGGFTRPMVARIRFRFPTFGFGKVKKRS